MEFALLSVVSLDGMNTRTPLGEKAFDLCSGYAIDLYGSQAKTPELPTLRYT